MVQYQKKMQPIEDHRGHNQIKKQLNSIVKNFKKPIDEQDLKVIIIEGLVPSVEDMINRIKREI